MLSFRLWCALAAATASPLAFSQSSAPDQFAVGAQFLSFKSNGSDKKPELRVGPVSADTEFAPHATEQQALWARSSNRFSVEYVADADLLRAVIENANGHFVADFPGVNAAVAARFGAHTTIDDINVLELRVTNGDPAGRVKVEGLTLAGVPIPLDAAGHLTLPHCLAEGLHIDGSIDLEGPFSNDVRKSNVTLLLGRADTLPDCDQNRAPTAVVTLEGDPRVGSSVTLTGADSSDPEGAELTYQWSLTQRPAGSAAVLVDTNGVAVPLQLDKPGAYEVRLVVHDGERASAPAVQIIDTLNSVPVADAGDSQIVPLGALVSLDGSRSTDLDGDALTYRWTMTGKPAASLATIADVTSATPAFVADRPGSYVLELIVNDGSVDSAASSVTVSTANSVPVAAISAPAQGLVGNTVAVDGGSSYDPDGEPLHYHWALLSRPAASQAVIDETQEVTAQFLLDAPGEFVVGLSVTDGRATSALVTTQVLAVQPNRDPAFTSEPRRDAVVGEAYTYTLQAVDPDHDPLSFGLAVSPAGMTLTPNGQLAWVPEVAGTYAVIVTVTDGRGGSASQSFSIGVIEATGVTRVIGPEGGVIAMPDGLSLEVPPGALANPVTIRVWEDALPNDAVIPANGVLAGKVYHFEPEGLRFDLPVELTVPYDPAMLPTGYNEADVFVHRKGVEAPFHIVGDAARPADDNRWQDQFAEANLLRVRIQSFSAYGAVGHSQAHTWVANRETAGLGSAVIKRPPGGMRTTKATAQNVCTGSDPIGMRAATDTAGVVIHTTNGGRPNGTLAGALGWATDQCVRHFAHYMIDKNGDIYQVTDDDGILTHASSTSPSGLTNANSIGIEVVNNVGEPYDGRQITALTRLIDYLFEKYGWTRPARDAATGLYTRNRTPISTGGERVVTHWDINGKCDPMGTMRSSAEYYALDQALGWTRCDNHGVILIAGGDANAPTLLDVIYDTLSMQQRSAQHSGVINTTGGDALGLSAPGNGGEVVLRQDAAAVEAVLGNAAPRDYSENSPLIVGPGTTRTLSGVQPFTDVIIAGRLEVTADLELQVKGTFYLGPNGRIVLRNGSHGGALRVLSRGVPVIQGLIDSTGVDSAALGTGGGAGGRVEFVWAGSGHVLVPTLITRGGDADLAANTTGSGGRGGNVTISVNDAVLFLGGGVGPLQTAGNLSTAHPPIRDVIRAPTLPAPPEYLGEHFPALMGSFNRYTSILAPAYGPNVQIPLRTAGFQLGFTRGVLTSGGTGGIGQGTAATNLDGGAGGDGGNVAVSVGADGEVTFRNIDLITGADVETATKQLILPEGGTTRYSYFFATGSLGGSGQWQDGFTNPSGGSGGLGGRAGNIAITGTLFPAPTAFSPVGPLGAGEIIGIHRPFKSVRPWTTDDFLGDFIFGRRIQAAAADGTELYRLRLDLTLDEPLGGSGGLQVGGISGEFPGWFGTKGANGTITGLPTR